MKTRESLIGLFSRYSVAGVAAFVFELGMLFVLLEVCDLPYPFSVPLAFCIATVTQWSVCHWWVFKSSGRKAHVEYVLFLGILFSGVVVATALVGLFVQMLHIDVISARILSSVFSGSLSFYLNARFNFKAHPLLHHHKRQR